MLADIILMIHFLYVSFVIGGLLAIWIGAYFQWEWIRNFWFRVIHLVAIGFVALESIFGVVCPLTEWENKFRQSSGGYQTSFMQHWIHKILFYHAAEEVFTVIYVLFTLLVAASLVFVRPRTP
ncbi:DUF2784 domain-containing protein [bacterium]|nr:DUF2784 domain-containing protein [bacterium]